MKAKSPNVVVEAVRILPLTGSKVRLEIKASNFEILAHLDIYLGCSQDLLWYGEVVLLGWNCPGDPLEPFGHAKHCVVPACL
jgi:hypothetical protein